ncbi:zinc-binding metallopeptidase family protein [Arthrobacter halodurans]|uniref:Zinc-binding metallopeptidase n=1 Tax=Arthrobacter halodurans TaxID=516699 RepID=A0ABV4UR95_9MICC
MKKHACRNCRSALFFENSRCAGCGSDLRYSRKERAIVPLDASGAYVDRDGKSWHVCRNLGLSGCTWLADREGGQCFGCGLTRTRPNDADAAGLSQFVDGERAKRRLIAELDALGLPIVTRSEDPQGGLAFDLLSSADANVVIGHADGVITIDLAETEDAYRERMRAQLDEPYRTMLGHFRHEVGHYFETVLVFADGERTRAARALFGDDTKDYQAEIDRHYAEGAPEGWPERHISRYATMHPYEDFAETFAHYLHIRDTLDTAREHGLAPGAPAAGAADGSASFRDVVLDAWLPLSVALNEVNRSMGANDLYPFAIPDAVLDKLEFIDSLIP